MIWCQQKKKPAHTPEIIVQHDLQLWFYAKGAFDKQMLYTQNDKVSFIQNTHTKKKLSDFLT